MHAPDGFLNAGTAAATGVVSLGMLATVLRSIGSTLKERQAPLAGVVAAFVFAAQMFNFPVAAGTSGHRRMTTSSVSSGSCPTWKAW